MKCNEFLNKILDWAKQNGPLPANASIEGLLEAMSTAVYAFGNNTHQELGNLTTLASGAQSTTTAVTVGRYVYLGDAFFGRGYNRVATLLHEALHVFWNTASLPHLPGAGGDRTIGIGLTDHELAMAAGVCKEGFGRDDSSSAFSNELRKNCR